MTAYERTPACRSRRQLAHGIVALGLCLGLLQATCISASEAEPSSSPDYVALLADMTGTVWIHPADGSEAERGTLGTRLQVGDTVETEMEALASIFVAGGQILDILGGSRIHISQDLRVPPEGGGKVAHLSSESLEILENGMWALNSSGGKAMVGRMRGGDSPSGTAPNSTLSPRREVVTEARPVFFWTSEEASVRVVLGQGMKVLWRSEAAATSRLRYPGGEAALAEGTYVWWLESEEGERLTRAASFQVASSATQHEVEAFEAEMANLARSAKGPHLVQVLRCAYYQSIGAWSKVLEVGDELARSDGGKDLAGSAGVRAQQEMRLGKAARVVLASLREGQGVRD